MRSLATLPLVLLGTLALGCQRPESAEPAPDAEARPLEVTVDPGPEIPPPARDRRGDGHLLAGRFSEAIADFDAFLEAYPSFEPQHWRRGIAYYYAGRYADGVRQFEIHRGVNPADVENATWHYLCKARLEDVAAARAALLPVGPDGRAPMREVYELYAGRMTPAQVEAAAEAYAARGDAYALFYGHLYLGLYFEAAGEVDRCRHHIGLAAGTHRAPGYMGDVAALHQRLLDDS